MDWGNADLFWLPTLAAIGIWWLGLLAVITQPARPAKRYWTAILLIAGFAAIGISAWEQAARRDAASRLDQVWTRFGEVKGLPPLPAGTSPDQTVDAVAGALNALNDRIRELEGQLAELRNKAQARTISAENAAGMVDLLKAAGKHRVVVSCIPDDVEAFAYANQIASVLRQAGWDALGPETTTIFGDGAGMNVALYARSGTAPPDTAKLLVDAFTRFNVPFRSGVMPSDAIPDDATVELFVGHKP